MKIFLLSVVLSALLAMTIAEDEQRLNNSLQLESDESADEDLERVKKSNYGYGSGSHGSQYGGGYEKGYGHGGGYGHGTHYGGHNDGYGKGYGHHSGGYEKGYGQVGHGHGGHQIYGGYGHGGYDKGYGHGGYDKKYGGHHGGYGKGGYAQESYGHGGGYGHSSYGHGHSGNYRSTDVDAAPFAYDAAADTRSYVQTAPPSYHSSQSYSTLTYPSPAPVVPCGKQVLVGCAPQVSTVPCKAPSYYNAPSYSHGSGYASPAVYRAAGEGSEEEVEGEMKGKKSN